ncbi:MAG UNVERIFIED_CONTAM: hypothetical protein LVR18_15255 [Planctomycetaceae bacterium]
MPPGISHAPVISVDILPTFAELAGVPGGSIPDVDGVSLAGLLRSGGTEAPQRRPVLALSGISGSRKGGVADNSCQRHPLRALETSGIPRRPSRGTLRPRSGPVTNAESR